MAAESLNNELNFYWSKVKNASDDIKLKLISMLCSSISIKRDIRENMAYEFLKNIQALGKEMNHQKK